MNKLFVATTALAVSLGAISCSQGGSAKLSSEADSLSYAQGISRGKMLAEQIKMAKEHQNLIIDKQALLKGFQEGLADSTKFSYFQGGAIGNSMLQGFKDDPNFNQAVFLKAFREALLADSTTKFALEVSLADSLANVAQEKAYEAMQAKQKEELEKKYASNKEKGIAYLNQFKKEEGVKTTESGLAYKVIQAGTGATPTDEDQVRVHYHGVDADGKVFDSSIDRGEPIEFAVTGVIKGWTEMLKLMKEGEKVKVVIPQELGYGESGPSPFGVLIFDIELIKVIKKDSK